MRILKLQSRERRAALVGRPAHVTSSRPRWLRGLLACALLIGASLHSVARADLKPLAANVGVDERIGQQLPATAQLTDENGTKRHLGELFEADKPVVLALAYFHCPGLCDISLRQLALRLRDLGWTLGKDYHALTISIDPGDTPAVAAAKRSNVLTLMHDKSTKDWPFFVADKATIANLTKVLGYHYSYDPGTKQFAHPAASFILTPAGKVARYVYGPTYELATLGLALREARLGRGGVSALIDRTVLSCFQYDPRTHRYEWLILGVMRGGAALIAIVLAIAVLVFVRRGRRLRRAH